MMLISTVAFLIRLIGLNQSLWLDEGTTAKVVQTLSYSGILTKFSPGDFHPPLYYLFLKFWTTIFGYSEISLRLPSVIFSILTGYVIYLIGKKLKGEEVGLWAAVFFLFNPLIVYYSQEARMYMMATFLLTVALYYLFNVKRLTLNVILFILFSILSFWTFYGSVFLIAAMMIYLLFKKQYKLFTVSCLAFGVACLAVSPLLYRQLVNSRQSLQTVANWSLVLGKANLKNLLLIPVKFSFGRISFYPKIIYYFIAGLWSLFVLIFVNRAGKKNKWLMFLSSAPILMGLMFSFYSPLLQYFRFLYLIPIISLLISLGADKNWQRIALFSGFLILSLVYLLNPRFHREDWQSLAKSLPGNRSIYMIESSADPLRYYRPDLSIMDLRQLNIANEQSLFIIPYTSEIHGVDYRKLLENNNFKLVKTASFRELPLEEWEKSSDL